MADLRDDRRARSEADPPTRAAALDAMAAIGGPRALGAIEELARPARPSALVPALAALARLDPAEAAGRVGRALAASPLRSGPHPADGRLPRPPGGAEKLAAALGGRPPSPDNAKLALRGIYALGRADESLVAVLSKAAGIEAEPGSRPGGEGRPHRRGRLPGGCRPGRGDLPTGRVWLHQVPRPLRRRRRGRARAERPGAQLAGQLRDQLDPHPRPGDQGGVPDPGRPDRRRPGLPGDRGRGGRQAAGPPRRHGRGPGGPRRLDRGQQEGGLADAQRAGRDAHPGRVRQPRPVPLRAGQARPLRIRPTPTIQRWRVLGRAPTAIAEVLRAEPGQWVPAYAMVAGDLPIAELVATERGEPRLIQGEIRVSAAGPDHLPVQLAQGPAAWLDDRPLPTGEPRPSRPPRGLAS